MAQANLSRRTFLAATAAATAAATRGARGRVSGANDRLSIGFIGVGDRAGAHLNEIHSLSEKHNAEITAVCDVWRPNRERAAARVKQWWGGDVRAFSRYEELLALPDIDAVVIAIPDFWHGRVLVDALKADKDVYIEKPMTIDLASANEALDLARSRNRVVQAGTQFRSSGGYRAVARAIADGVLGPVNRVTAAMNFNQPRWRRPTDSCKEEDVDWKAYMPDRPFDVNLLRRWHLYRATSNGLSGLWMAHYSDITHIITGAKYPTSAVAEGGIFVWDDGREHTDTFHCILKYPEGFLYDWGMGLGNAGGTFFTVHGTKATLDIGNNSYNPSLLEVIPEGRRGNSQTTRIKPDPSESHVGNWLECIRSRKRPNADIQFGHQHAVATILAAEALFQGRRLIYDPEKREIRAS